MGGRFRRRKTKIDRRRRIGRQRHEQRRLALFENFLVRQAADALGDPVIEKRDLFRRR